MSMWLDFLQVALALGIGWLGWVLLMLARPLARPSVAPGRRGAAFGGPAAPAVVKGQAVDSDR